MVKTNDCIQFESRYEIDDVINALETYQQEHPKAEERETINVLCHLLSAMFMEW